MKPGPAVISEALAEALSGHKCVTAWLGYGNALFLGFGDNLLPEHDSNGNATKPPFEVETNFADWTLQSADAQTNNDDDEELAERNIRTVLGRPVTGWTLSKEFVLQIMFGLECHIKVTPITDADLAGKDSWSLSFPDKPLIAVSCDGRIAVVRTNTPISRWFT